MGLTALLLLQHARAPARFDAQGEIVLLEDQDRGLWSRKMIDEGLALVDKALRHRKPGPYQVQAAIAALHARAGKAQDTDWVRIAALYETLARIAPSPVVELNRAVALSKAFGPAAGLKLVDELADEPALKGYHLLPSVRADLLARLGRHEEARAELERAAALAQNARERAMLLARAAAGR